MDIMGAKSEELYKKSTEYMPGGVNSPVRSFYAVNRSPIFIDHAVGDKIYDVDGAEYIDYVCSWGPGILGHADKDVLDSVRSAIDKGLTFGAPTEREYEIAKLIQEMVPSMEMLRLVNSGTEATMSAIRVARGYTGKDKIIKFRGCYHGHSDGLLVKAGSGAITGSIPDSLGVPKGYAENTLVAEYNDLESVEELFKNNLGNVAGIIVEPVAANMGIVLPEEGFLQGLRSLADKYDSLLIFDEVITGFRLAPGGAQELFGVKPDLSCFGKIVGGGMPLAVYGGRKDIMKNVAPLGGVYQAGTLAGNPVATAAGLATLKKLQNNSSLYEDINNKTKYLADGIREYFKGRAVINRVGSLMSIFFTKEDVVDYDSVMKCDTGLYAKFFCNVLDKGVYLPPSQYESMFISAAHSYEDIDKTIEIICSGNL
ncbi:MAG: glutamate-1-semialdehyde 2,1-aminomutase [Lachnospiraceae bacterium]|nr:glutamate-1-semialdehyde 2,1-aminomutase [Lachnospiraceae bacterium]